MLHTSPLAAAAGKRDIQEKEDEEEEHKEEEKRTCEMWQLKLSSGGGTYGIHFCVVFDDDWSFKPKNILVVVVVVSCCEGKNNTHAVPPKKKVDSSKYSSSSVAPRERRPHRVGTFNQSSLLRCRFAPHSGSQALRSKTFQRRLSFSWKRHHQLETPIFEICGKKKRNAMMGGGEKKKKQLSGAQKRKKKKENEDLAAEMERLKLGPTTLWTGLVTHHKDIFVSHVLSKLNTTDRYFFGMVNSESRDVLKYTGVNASGLGVIVYEYSSISTLEFVWNNIPWGKKFEDGNVADQAWFCFQVAGTNKLEFLKWAREVKHCEWNEWTITMAAVKGNLEMLRYCFSNDCPCDKKESCEQAAAGGNLDCLRFLFDKVKPSRDTEEKAAVQAACGGHVDILKYFVEERKISDDLKLDCVGNAARYGGLDCIKYLVEEVKTPLNRWDFIANARYHEHPECENYLLEKGCPEPTDEEYAEFVKGRKEQH